jgi:hypothetical protein
MTTDKSVDDRRGQIGRAEDFRGPDKIIKYELISVKTSSQTLFR